MAERSLLDWMRSQDPIAPEAFLRLLELQLQGTLRPELLDALIAEARSALGDALAGEGERQGAFRLLAADALLTWAAEAALDTEDPEAALRLVLQAVLDEARGR